MRPSVSQTIRRQLIGAMEQRAARLDGEARRVLDTRITALRAQLVDAQDAMERGHVASTDAASLQASPLAELIESIAGDASTERTVYPELPSLDAFRSLWSTIRSDSQLQQSEAPTPTDTGPLNSAALAGRSIALMRKLSPEYLRQFLAYVDHLAWLEQARADLPSAVGSGSPKKSSGRKRRS